jgi:XTP/dITP diphosphohydrolase
MLTSNPNKFKEAKSVMGERGIKLEQINLKRVEIQADDLVEIATQSLKYIEENGLPILVEDAGIFIDQYGGFPGPYSSYVLRKIGLSGILKLMENVENRESSFKSAIALKIQGEIHHFKGEVTGSIAHKKRGEKGFGYDPIFIPERGNTRTFGEMLESEKNALSHRSEAFRNLAYWISNKYKKYF